MRRRKTERVNGEWRRKRGLRRRGIEGETERDREGKQGKKKENWRKEEEVIMDKTNGEGK